MASVIFGLYENKDNRLPYALCVVGFDENEILMFTSRTPSGLNNNAISYREWIMKHPQRQEISERTILRYEPNIISYKMQYYEQTYDDNYFRNLWSIANMDLQENWSIYNKRVHVLLYKDISLTEEHLPQLMWYACEETKIAWHEYFDNTQPNKTHPNIDVNKIILSLNDFKEIRSSFDTITKISSLSYEKIRSKGSIAVMKNDKDTPLISFAANEEQETLPFAIEYAKQLRKLLETTKNGLSLLIHNGKVYGIGEPDPIKTLYTFNLTGHMEWHIIDHRKDEKGCKKLRYKHGEYYLPKEDEIRTWYINSKIKDEELRKIITNLLSEEHAKAFEHGAILIITDDAENEVNRLCKLKRGLRIEPISITANFEKLYALCAIDGALFLDTNGHCHGIGIILDGEAIIVGTPARGARYNSTKTYVSRCVKEKIEAYALVMSTDGNFDILTSHDDEFRDVKV